MTNEHILELLYDYKLKDKIGFVNYGLNLLKGGKKYRDERIIKYEKIVCDFFFVNPDELFTVTRKREIVEARYFVWYFLKRDYPNLSLPFLGKIYNRDHATVINGIKRIREWCETDKFFKSKVEEIDKLVK